MSSYYRPRYASLFAHAQSCLESTSDPGCAHWDLTDACDEIFAHELAWQMDKTTFPSAPTADALEVSKAMFAKYDRQTDNFRRPSPKLEPMCGDLARY